MKRILSSRFIVLSLALSLVFSLLGTMLAPGDQAYAAADQNRGNLPAEVFEAADATAKLILAQGVQSDWQAIALVRGGYKLPDSYRTSLVNDIKSAKGTYSNVTDYARRVLAATALGLDASNISSYNLIEKIYNNDKMTRQGINGILYSLLALDAGHYKVPSNAKWTTDKLASELVAKQNADGGFTLSTGTSDPDLTAMVLTALSSHMDNAAVKSAGEKAVEWLTQKQQSHGGLGDSSESVSQAIIALTANKVDPTGERFTKNGNNLVGRLLSFRTANGGFAHTQAGPQNDFATEQALQALVAYQLYVKGEAALYALSQPSAPAEPVKEPANDTAKDSSAQPAGQAVPATVVVEGPAGFIGEGEVKAATALQALQQLDSKLKLGLETTRVSLGEYVSGIKGIQAGLYGGYDGWNYAVSRKGEWVYPSVSITEFVLEQSDRLVIYYGDSATQLISAVTTQPARPDASQSFTVNVLKSSLDWESGKVITTPAAGVQVQVGSQTVTADTAGKAVFPAGAAAGMNTLTITGYRDGQAPTIARYSGSLAVSPLFKDQKLISAWAVEAVEAASEQGLMNGINKDGLVFAPKQHITRAEFAALLVRLTGHNPLDDSAQSPFMDVKTGAWYTGYVLKAKELGFIDGVTAAKFQPHGAISRQDMAVMIARAFNLPQSAPGQKLKDEGKISNYALTAVRAVTASGYMSGYNGIFDPAAPVTREMAAVVAVKLP